VTAGELPDGVYDRLISRSLDEQLRDRKVVRATVEEAETAQALGERRARLLGTRSRPPSAHGLLTSRWTPDGRAVIT
jgi:hypothetical protein